MQLRVEVFNKYGGIASSDLSLEVREKRIFLFNFLEEISDDLIGTVKKILHNPVLQEIKVIDTLMESELEKVDVLFLPGMTDNVSESIKSAMSLTALKDHKYTVHTGKCFEFLGPKDIFSLKIEDFNPLLHFKVEMPGKSKWKFPDLFLKDQSDKATFDVIEINKLDTWIQGNLLAFNQTEIDVIIDYYKNQLKRNPTDVEIEVIAQTWSEHCKHKIFAADYQYSESKYDAKSITPKKISSLFSTFIKSTVKPHHKDCVSVFHDNAGVMRWDESIDLCIKVETHNSPSALDPFSGAVTGVLGVQRDIMGTGRGAKPIANMDVFCVGRLDDYPLASDGECPDKLLHPKTILMGVHKGVEEGGNKMGVPTVNGSFQFHPNYAGKPLIYVGSVGVMPRNIGSVECVNKEILCGDFAYVGGGRLGRDGIHGATFSSLSMEGEIPASVVQIGDPITQKKLLDFTLKARDKGLIRGLTDNGAGGVSSSLGELAQYTNGITIAIDKHPLKYTGLKCFEMVISESQERMSYAIPPEKAKEFENLAHAMGVEVSKLGEFNNKGNFTITYNNELIADLPLEFLHEACPKMSLTAEWQGPSHPEYWYRKLKHKTKTTIAKDALTLLASPNICSKEDWVRVYDHEVQGASIGKPFQGKTMQAPSNSGVIDLEMHGGKENTALAIGHGFSAKLSCYDTYWMAQIAIDECIRNLVASGANPKKIALLDNFCWPNPFLETSKHRLGQLVRANEAIKDMATLFDLPFISGKDSMKNSFQGINKAKAKVAIDVEPSLLISGIGYVEDHRHLLPSSFVNDGDNIYFVGLSPQSLLGSEYSYYFETSEDLKVPQYDFIKAKEIHDVIYQLITANCLQSIHDISDGGLICALYESMIGNHIGCELTSDLDMVRAFGEAPAGYIVSVKKSDKEKFESMTAIIPTVFLGKTTGVFEFKSPNELIKGEKIVEAWRTPLC